uniref:Photosystem II 12 kDa extrinsic protein n=1 Tax=Alexandrium catenella TaxID=2925 RepID=A0A7S1QH41_ALECA|mmetsp:Transcript_30620/g.82904  ORF Transcript_30620/g.82904 Transcript_30620/m.82904 type:complete len:196 (+) Transcript_30620:76-663(+)
MALLVRASLLACLAAPAVAYVAPAHREVSTSRTVQSTAPAGIWAAQDPVAEETADARAGPFGLVAASVAIGAALGWLSSRRQQVASATAAAAVALTPIAAPAIVEYDGIKYLGGTDKVDINNANVQAYRQFPGFYPTAAGSIATHGPYKSVKDIYGIPNLDPRVVETFKKYEANLVCLPPSPAYYLDRVNNFMYR